MSSVVESSARVMRVLDVSSTSVREQFLQVVALLEEDPFPGPAGVGESVTLDGYQLTVSEMDGVKIESVVIAKL